MSLNLAQNLARKLKPSIAFRELSKFLNKDGPVWLTIKSLTHDLNDEKINYAIIGGLAVYQHGYVRTTGDCDILLAKADHEKFMKRLVKLGLKRKVEGSKKKFIYTSTGTSVVVIIEGEYPGDGRTGPIAFPNPEECHEHIDNMNVISLPKLIDLKLASYQSLPRSRQKDLADIIELIKILNLNRSFADLLHPAVRNEFEQLILGLEQDRQKGSVDDE